MKIIARILKVVGMIWIIVSSIVILIGYAKIWYDDGFFALTSMLSPFNIWNFLAVVLTLSPGLILVYVSDMLSKKNSNKL